MKIGIAGLGLIGGSLALALRDRHDVSGFDISRAARDAASGAGLRTVDRLDALLPADAVIVATPIDAVLPTLSALAPAAREAVLIDVASVRAPIEGFARENGHARLVGMHPMAGRTAQGFAAADPALLASRPFLLVPTASADSEAMSIAGRIARDAGGEVTVLSADLHDRAMAYLSALPLAVAAATTMAAIEGDLRFAGPGIRDTTRLALTPEELALELMLRNSKNLHFALDSVIEHLEHLRDHVDDADRTYLRDFLRAARIAREELEGR